jgi:hypothetical protein
VSGERRAESGEQDKKKRRRKEEEKEEEEEEERKEELQGSSPFGHRRKLKESEKGFTGRMNIGKRIFY